MDGHSRAPDTVCDDSVDDERQEAIRIVADEIRAYLESNPNAADSLEGVARWWHGRKRYEESRETVRAALEFLQQEGTVRSRQIALGETIYYRSGKGSEE